MNIHILYININILYTYNIFYIQYMLPNILAIFNKADRRSVHLTKSPIRMGLGD